MAGDRDLSKEVIFEKKTQGNERVRDPESWERAHQAWKNGKKRPRGRSRRRKGRSGTDGKRDRQVGKEVRPREDGPCSKCSEKFLRIFSSTKQCFDFCF